MHLDGEQTIIGQDGRTRHYRVFRWQVVPPAVQMELLHVETPAMQQMWGFEEVRP
ncbi:MAG: hypothetical protein HC804_02335 [Anaerolineae bacterium]|nr:hypothetical protein [Anaerolineae bacterium]